MVLKDLQSIFLNPKKIELVNPIKKRRVFFGYIFYYFLLTIIFSAIVGILFNIEKVSIVNNSNNFNFLKLVIISPIIEELIFRLILRFNRINIIVFIISLFTYLLYYNFLISIDVYYITILFIIVFFYVMKIKFKKLDILIEISSKKLLLLVYIFSFSFGFYHLQNINLTICLSIFIYILSKVFNGFYFSMIRLKFGFTSVVFLHMLNNFFAYLLVTF